MSVQSNKIGHEVCMPMFLTFLFICVVVSKSIRPQRTETRTRQINKQTKPPNTPRLPHRQSERGSVGMSAKQVSSKPFLSSLSASFGKVSQCQGFQDPELSRPLQPQVLEIRIWRNSSGSLLYGHYLLGLEFCPVMI